MRITETYITLNEMSFYAYHGVGQQERITGNTYLVNLRLKTDISRAMESDNVEDTINYATVYQVVATEMATPSNLLEHVCGRIVTKLFETFPPVTELYISLCKRNPPMGADIGSAGVEMHCYSTGSTE